MIKEKRQKNKGFTLLFAVLISSMVLIVGASIITIALKQNFLSGSARESQYAFYASNSGLECAMYWDIAGIAGQAPIFATSTESNLDYSDARSNIKCAGAMLIDSASETSNNNCLNSNIYEDTGWCVDAGAPNGSGNATTTSKFRIQQLGSGGDKVSYCADVFVTKATNNGTTYTIIESMGYNTCDNDFRRVERGLRIRY